MAEPVIVPVQLEITDVDMSGFNTTDAQKQISSSLSSVRKSMEQVFSKIDTSKATKPMLTHLQSLENGFVKLNRIQEAFYKEAVKAGKATDEYKKLASTLDEAKKQLTNLDSVRSAWENDAGDYIGTPAMWETYLDACEKYETQLFKVQDLQRQVDDPASFAKFADEGALANMESTLRKLMSAASRFNQEAETVNQLIADNRASDEYQELIKQAEVYKKKLADLNEKSKEMEFKGATDTQWENLRKDTEWTSSKMDEILQKMDKAIKSGKAFRFGDGPKGEFRNQLNSFKMSAQNNAGYASRRAKENQSPYTEDYQKALDELDKLEKKVESIRAKSAKMIATGASKKSLEGVVYDAKVLETKVNATKNRLTELVNSGKAFKFGKGNTAAEITKINEKSSELKANLSKVATSAKSAQHRFAAIAKVVAGGFGKAVSTIGRVTSGIYKSIKNMNLFGKAGRGTSTDLNKRFKKLGRNILMFGFGFRTLYYAVKRLRTIFIESFKVMGDQFEEVGQPMKTLIESFNRLKGSLATAFQPIASVLMPILTQLMNSLSGVLEKIGEFTATLTGQGRIYKAVAKNINSVADAAGNANDKLGSYDKLEVISQDNNNTGVDYEMQEVEAGSAASNFAQMVKDAWEKADFTGVGQYVTEQLLGVLDTIEQTIIPKVANFANKVITSINTFLTGFDSTAIGDKVGSIFNTLVTALDWTQLGALFANLNNTVWGFFDGLVNNIDWAALGQSLATGIESMFNTLDLDKWVGMTGGLIIGLTTALVTVIDNVDWDQILNKLFTALQKLLTSVGGALSNSSNPLVAAFGKVILAINDTITALKPAVEAIIKAVGPIIESILPIISKLLPPIAQIVSTVVTALLPPLVKLFQALLPPIIRLAESLLPMINTVLSIVMEYIRRACDIITFVVMPVVEVLIDGLANTIDIIDAVLRLLTGDFSAVKDIWSGMLKAWKQPINAILALIQGLVNGILLGVNSMIRSLNKISIDIPDWVPGLGGKKFGFNFKEISTIKIPRLAQGAVIPPNKEFLAMLGDQKSGTNIEAPLDTIKQALAEVIAEIGGMNKEPIVLQVNGRALAKVVWDEQEKRYKQTGKYSPA